MATLSPSSTVKHTPSSMCTTPSGPSTDLPTWRTSMTLGDSLGLSGGRLSMRMLPMRWNVLPGLVRLGSAWLLLALSMLAPAWAHAKGPVLVVGDSLSAAHNLPADTGWVTLLERRLKDMKAGTAVVNASISGETTAGALTRLPGLLSRHRPAVVVIALGGNDALRGLTPVQLRANLDRMVVLSQQADAKVLLVGIDVPPNYGPAYRQRLRDTYADLARVHATGLLPFLLEGVALAPGMMQADGLHPTAQAQPRLLENVWEQLKPLL